MGTRERVVHAGAVPGGLLERAKEVAESGALLEAARGGTGELLAFVGPPGIGKTRLLATVRERGGELGITVLSARGAEMEREFPFGIARQLFEPVLASASPKQREALLAGAARLAGSVVGEEAAPEGLNLAADASFAALHGLYWLTANLAAQAPLLIAVDDVHWSDPASLRWLAYLAGRLEGLPVLVAVAARSRQPGADEAAVGIIDQHATRVLRPAPLSDEALGTMLESELGDEPAAEFVAACHEATGGNPFLLHELISHLRESRVAPARGNASHVREIGPAGVSRAALARLARLTPASVPLARAVAVLESRVELRQAAALAGIDESEAAQAADLLAEADILERTRPLEFVHPIVRAAIYTDIPPLERAGYHFEAARIAWESSRDAAQVGAHLLSTEPARDPWVVERLGDAAAQALARGAPEAAAAYLRRALSEPPEPALRTSLLTQLGVAEAALNEVQGAIEHLKQALEAGEDPVERGHTARPLAQILLLSGRPEEAIEVVDEIVDALPDGARELASRLRCDRFVAGYMGLRARRAVVLRRPEVPPHLRRPGDLLLVASSALDAALEGPAAEAVRLARRALGEGRLLAEEGADSPAFYMAAIALLFADELALGHHVYSDAIAQASARGSLRGFAMAASCRAAASWRLGSVPDAEADARSALETFIAGTPGGVPLAAASLLDALRERGELEAAEKALDELGSMGPADAFLMHLLLDSRGRLRLAAGRTEEGLEDLLECGRLEEAWGIRTPAVTLWRSHAAVALKGLGEEAEAHRLLKEELRRAREFGSPRAVGVALRALGLVEGGEQGIAKLREAIATLESSPARLEHARALVDLGAALRRAGLRKEAREPLREGMRLARQCGATALVESAYEELEATGARPRKIVLAGVEALTPSERRIAEMASRGMKNKEIAQALFVTAKTVEVHLGHAYTKLGIRSRVELPEALAEHAGSNGPPR